jgi:patatin-like phospholipase/acyl hydrolase
LVARTSTGSLPTAMITTPDPTNPTQSLFSANKVTDFYMANALKIFPLSMYNILQIHAYVISKLHDQAS